MEKIYDQISIEAIEKLAEIVRSSDLSEITIENGDSKVTVKGRKSTPPAPAIPFAMPAMAAQTAAPVQDGGAVFAEAPQQSSGNVVKSPIVGTFYAAPAPDKAPFVRIGDTVKKGDVIMIIESMKLMNEIQSEFDGTVKEILVSDGQAVEFEQPVMIIE
ncbi:MAG: acetyl-CoA carboxylase biotin carboxyl carrier protein [Ruminococcus sp.]|nr:acetyl-CoA carboxylase biotin carboxyl carrier protein [Ruminococcus sp.]